MTREEGQQFIAQAVSHALAAAQMKQEVAALIMGISPSQFSRQLRGLEHLSLQRLTMIEDGTFWLALLTEFRARFAVEERPSEVAKALEQLVQSLSRVALELMHVRMVQADLPRRRATDRVDEQKAIAS